MKNLFKILVVFSFLINLNAIETVKKDNKTLNYTKEEKEWIKNNPLVKIAMMNYWNSDDNGNNIHRDFFKLLNKYGDITFIPVNFDTWKNGFNQAKQGDYIHGIMNLSYSKEREKNYFNYTTPYGFEPNYLITKKSNKDIKTLKDLKSKTVYIKEKSITKKILENLSNDIKIIELKDEIEMFKRLSSKNEADAIISYAIFKDTFEKYDLKLVEKIYNKYSQLYIGISKKHEPLKSIINKIISIIPKNELSKIQNKTYKKNQFNLHLTKEEKNWIKNNTVKVGVEQVAPVIFFNDKNEIDGISGDILKLVIKRTNLNVEFVNDLWDPLLRGLKDKQIDLLPATYYTDERSKFGLYTSDYFKMLDYIYVKESNNIINSMEDLEGKRLAIPKNFGTIEKIKKRFPKIKIVTTLNLADSVSKVLKGEVDALYDGQLSVEYYIQENLVQGLKPIPQKAFEAAKLHFFTRIDKPILNNILQKGLESISRKEKRDIISKWIDVKNEIEFTPKEQKWLNKNIPVRYVYDPDWAPFEWKNDVKKHSGIISDILNIIANRSGLELIAIDVEKWSDAVVKAKNKEVDMYSGVNQTLEKSEYMNFTKKSIYQTPYVFVTRLNDTNDYFDTFKALKNKKIAVVKGYSIHDTLLKENKNFPLITVNSTKDGFKKLQNKEIDVFLANAATAKYYINRLGFNDLRIATKTKYNLDLKIAIRKDWPKEVISIIDKTMETITQKELDSIYHKWTKTIIKEKIDWYLIIEIAGAGFIIIIFILYNNRQLKNKVEQKTAEIKTLLKSFDKNVIASKTDKNGNIIYASKAFCEISGYTQEELLGNSHSIVKHPDTPKEVFEELWSTIKNDDIWKGELKNKRKDGSYYWVDIIISPECNPNGDFCGYSAIRQDITAKKEVEQLSKTLEQRVEERTSELNDERKYINAIMNSQTNIVISSDGKCLRTANKAFLNFYNVNSTDEFSEKYGDCICDTFDKNDPKEFIQKMVNGEKWIDYVYSRPNKIHKVKITRENKEYIFTITADKFTFKGSELKTAVFNDITEIENIRKNVEMILSNILLPILITSKETRKIIYANKYAQSQYGKSIKKLIGMDIDDIYSFKGQHNHILNAMEKDGKVEGFEEVFKTAHGKEFTALLNVTPIIYNNEDAYIGMVTDITKQKEIEQEIRLIHTRTRDSIEYASLIQGSLIPDTTLFEKYFKDYFTIWEPKDVIGGDIYLFDELRDENECMLMVIDCTGHGVPGAFVTMLVKAIERQISAIIANDPTKTVNTAWCLEYFNKNMKKLLKQEGKESISNAGFDGQILYYNKKEQYVKFASARNELFYIQNDEIFTIKGDRHSIGYKDSDADYKFKEHTIDVSVPTNFYISSDGYWDQLGGQKELPFGKKRLKKLLNEIYEYPMAKQEDKLLNALKEYQNKMERQDDVTMVGLKIEP